MQHRLRVKCRLGAKYRILGLHIQLPYLELKTRV